MSFKINPNLYKKLIFNLITLKCRELIAIFNFIKWAKKCFWNVKTSFIQFQYFWLILFKGNNARKNIRWHSKRDSYFWKWMLLWCSENVTLEYLFVSTNDIVKSSKKINTNVTFQNIFAFPRAQAAFISGFYFYQANEKIWVIRLKSENVLQINWSMIRKIDRRALLFYKNFFQKPRKKSSISW